MIIVKCSIALSKHGKSTVSVCYEPWHWQNCCVVMQYILKNIYAINNLCITDWFKGRRIATCRQLEQKQRRPFKFCAQQAFRKLVINLPKGVYIIDGKTSQLICPQRLWETLYCASNPMSQEVKNLSWPRKSEIWIRHWMLAKGEGDKDRASKGSKWILKMLTKYRTVISKL